VNILHIVAHLGGGVGKAISNLVISSVEQGNIYKHTIICLEENQKKYYCNKIVDSGAILINTNNISVIKKLIDQCDILQVEWWNHPFLLKILSSINSINCRLIIWCHTSGIYNSIIPDALINICQKVVFTSSCSFKAKNITFFSNKLEKELFQVISSGTGIEKNINIPFIKINDKKIRSCYVGTLNFSKLNPRFVEYLSKIEDTNFKIDLYGDVVNKEHLINQCIDLNRKDMLVFNGFKENIISELVNHNLFIYLLNERHYGTAENALLEAMSLGIAPIVLNNPAESSIIQHNKTGFIVENGNDFKEQYRVLLNNQDLKFEIGYNASEFIKKEYTVKKIYNEFVDLYNDIIKNNKVIINFVEVFGDEPYKWFLSVQEPLDIFLENDINEINAKKHLNEILDLSKGSIMHYYKYFPFDNNIINWKNKIESI